jgi:hypothetical protein
LYVDEDSMQRPVMAGVRAAGIDVITVSEAGRLGRSDHDHLEYATSLDRTVFTSNVRDFARLHRQWWSANRVHGGIVALVDQRTPIRDQVDALVRICSSLDSNAMRGRFEYLSNWLTRGD